MEKIGLLVLRLIPPCFRRFPDGRYYYVAGGRLLCMVPDCFILRAATWGDLVRCYRRYWHALPVMADPPNRNWWWRWRPSR